MVLGIQFSPPKGYQQIHAGGVWELFRNEYPEVQEQQPLPPAFETFGLPHQRSLLPQISFATGASHDRFWFLRPGGEELIQFQQDRLLHNWRKVNDEASSYPRFESMLESFNAEAHKLQRFLATLAPQNLHVTQCEISYVNQIKVSGLKDEVHSDWLRFLTFGKNKPDDFSITLREVIRDESQNPHGRITCEAASAVLPSGEEVIQLTLIVRGAPKSTDIESALDFLKMGRLLIVQRFTDLTTDMAHKRWERTI